MKGRRSFTQQEAEAIIQLIRQKLLAGTDEQKKIRNRIRALGFYASDFGIGGGYSEHDFLSVIDIIDEARMALLVPAVAEKTVMSKQGGRKDSDEHYVIDLCDELLGQRALRQHSFSFLPGDSGRPLPVDAYYASLRLVVGYHERQHTSEISFWDSKPTVSGISRALQRKLYDERRLELLPKNGIRLLIVDYQILSHKPGTKKLLRDSSQDKAVLQEKLQAFIKS